MTAHTVVARFLRSAANPLVADPNSRFDLLWPAQPDMATDNGCAAFASSPQRAICQPFSNHNGGKIAFGPDGYLYIGMGDGGSGGDPQNQAQRPATLLGKMLRIDVERARTATRAATGFPPTTRSSACPRWRRRRSTRSGRSALRNPWRFTFDPTWLGGTGAMLIGDVGQSAFEEIDYEPARLGGRNYGWRLREGAHDFNAGTTPAFTPLIEPIFEYADAFGTNGSTLDHRRLRLSRHRARRRLPRPLLLRRLHLRPDRLDRADRRPDDAARRRRPTSRSTPPPSTRPATSARSTSTPTARSTS